MKAIGGYFELEFNKIGEYHQGAIRLNTGRPDLAAVSFSSNHSIMVRLLRLAKAVIASFWASSETPSPCFCVETRMYPKQAFMVDFR